ncbi:MAG: hypothetical protein KUG64_09975 [Cycloclasticus sp.]|nr:hypothetical protein [Cycloclasticus sp.]
MALWSGLLSRLAPFHLQVATGIKRNEPEVRLRIYYLHQWNRLSDPAAEETLCDIASIPRFAGPEDD